MVLGKNIQFSKKIICPTLLSILEQCAVTLCSHFLPNKSSFIFCVSSSRRHQVKHRLCSRVQMRFTVFNSQFTTASLPHSPPQVWELAAVFLNLDPTDTVSYNWPGCRGVYWEWRIDCDIGLLAACLAKHGGQKGQNWSGHPPMVGNCKNLW